MKVYQLKLNCIKVDSNLVGTKAIDSFTVYSIVMGSFTNNSIAGCIVVVDYIAVASFTVYTKVVESIAVEPNAV